jgi:hypothetical protein
MTPKYQRLPNGSFKIWFFGTDGDDDDGRGPGENGKNPGPGPNADYDIVLTPGPPIP